MSVGLPSLSNFFKGRGLDYEGRRLLALARHGQSRAVSEGMPMLLWFDAREKRYGLEQEPGWDERDGKAQEFKLAPDLELEVVETNVVQFLLPSFQLQADTTAMTEAQRQNLPEIRFLPDGSIEETSPPKVILRDKEGVGLVLVRSENRLTYELRPEQDKQ